MWARAGTRSGRCTASCRTAASAPSSTSSPRRTRGCRCTSCARQPCRVATGGGAGGSAVRGDGARAAQAGRAGEGAASASQLLPALAEALRRRLPRPQHPPVQPGRRAPAGRRRGPPPGRRPRPAATAARRRRGSRGWRAARPGCPWRPGRWRCCPGAAWARRRARGRPGQGPPPGLPARRSSPPPRTGGAGWGPASRGDRGRLGVGGGRGRGGAGEGAVPRPSAHPLGPGGPGAPLDRALGLQGGRHGVAAGAGHSRACAGASGGRRGLGAGLEGAAGLCKRPASGRSGVDWAGRSFWGGRAGLRGSRRARCELRGCAAVNALLPFASPQIPCHHQHCSLTLSQYY